MSFPPRLQKNWTMGTLANSLLSSDLGNQRDMVLKRHANRKALGHTIKGSGNGTTGGMDGVDRWSSSSDLPTGSNGVWCVYHQPGSGAEDMLSFHNFGENDYTIAHSPGGNFTGGSSSAAPTASDQATLFNNSWFGRGDAPVNPTNPQFVLNYWCSDDLTCYRESYWNNNAPFGDLDFSAIDDPTDGWTIPGGGTPWSVPNYGMADKHANTLVGANTIGYQPNYAYNPFAAVGLFKTWGPHGAMNMFATLEASGYGTSPIATSLGALLVKNKISNKYRTPFQPGLYEIYSNSDGGLHGRIFDMWWVAQSANTGSVFTTGSTVPLDGSKQFVIIGDKMLPWNGGAFRTT